MRKYLVKIANARALFFCLFCFVSTLHAQQQNSNTAMQPAATDGNSRSEERHLDRPPPEFDRQPGSANLPRSLTVKEAVALALTRASIYQQAELEERIAREDVRQARASFMPRLSMPLSYAGATPALDQVVGESRIGALADDVHAVTGFFNAAGEVDISGRLRATLARSKHLLDAARAGTLAARRALVLNTVDAYYNLVLARQKRRLAEETLSLAEGFVKVTQGLLDRHEGEESDVLRARTQSSARRDELSQARAGEAAAMDALRTFTGIDFATPISVSSITENLPTTNDFSNYAEELLQTRPELAQIDAQRRASLDDARAARRELFPQLSYSLNAGYDAAAFQSFRRYGGGLGVVSLTIPMIDFGASRSRAAQARLRAQALDVQRELTVRQLKQEFYTSRAVALAALDRIRETQSGANTAQRNLTLVFMRYRQKKATITDVVDAQSAYADARFAYYQAIIDYRTARIRLEQNPAQ